MNKKRIHVLRGSVQINYPKNPGNLTCQHKYTSSRFKGLEKDVCAKNSQETLMYYLYVGSTHR